MMTDEAGGDEKIIAVPSTKLTRRYENVRDYSDLPEITLEQIKHFFAHDKDLEGEKWVKVDGWVDAVVSTGALMAHGFVEATGRSHFKYDPSMDDQELYEKGYDRVYDTLELEGNLMSLERIVHAG